MEQQPQNCGLLLCTCVKGALLNDLSVKYVGIYESHLTVGGILDDVVVGVSSL